MYIHSPRINGLGVMQKHNLSEPSATGSIKRDNIRGTRSRSACVLFPVQLVWFFLPRCMLVQICLLVLISDCTNRISCTKNEL